VVPPTDMRELQLAHRVVSHICIGKLALRVHNGMYSLLHVHAPAGIYFARNVH